MRILILMLLLTACKINKPLAPPIIDDKCVKVSCIEEEPEEPTEQQDEPIIEEKPDYYNHSLYFKKFRFWGFNFVSNDRLNKNGQTEFISTNTTQVPIASQYKKIYAKILFKNGEKAKIQYINSSTHALEETHERDWLIKDDFEFHIDGYRAGWFGWHSVITPTMKTQDEIDEGVERYVRTTNESQIIDIYYLYYFD